MGWGLLESDFRAALHPSDGSKGGEGEKVPASAAGMQRARVFFFADDDEERKLTRGRGSYSITRLNDPLTDNMWSIERI